MANNKVSDSWQGYYGIKKVALKDEFTDDIRNLFEIGKNKLFIEKEFVLDLEKKYSYIKIIDSFFSDTLNLDILVPLIQQAKRYQYMVQVLLLNPFSPVAKLRSQALGKNGNIRRLNRGLGKILAVLNDRREERQIENPDDPQTIIDQLDEISKLRDDFNLEIRFTSQYTEIPVYIVFHHAFKGHLFINSSARDNPWLICVDDPLQRKDLYDTYYENFNTLWKLSETQLKLAQLSTRNQIIPKSDVQHLDLSIFDSNEGFKLHVRNLIGRGELEEVIDYLLTFFNKYQETQEENENAAFQISGNYFRTKKRYILGFITEEDYKVELAKIRESLLFLIDSIV